MVEGCSMTPREDVYEVLALLGDLERVLHPLLERSTAELGWIPAFAPLLPSGTSSEPQTMSSPPQRAEQRPAPPILISPIERQARSAPSIAGESSIDPPRVLENGETSTPEPRAVAADRPLAREQ